MLAILWHARLASSGAKSAQAYAQAERLTQATAEYITAQRALMATVLADTAETTKASITARVDPVQAFLKQTLDESATFEVQTGPLSPTSSLLPFPFPAPLSPSHGELELA